jgi:HD-GYP domain-containing protein (c-di-GMP phosphodiesterase class II)
VARIIAIADAFDAITSDRPYRRGKSLHTALEEIKCCANRQFDPNLVNVFVSTVDQLTPEELMSYLQK